MTEWNEADHPRDEEGNLPIKIEVNKVERIKYKIGLTYYMAKMKNIIRNTNQKKILTK